MERFTEIGQYREFRELRENSEKFAQRTNEGA